MSAMGRTANLHTGVCKPANRQLGDSPGDLSGRASHARQLIPSRPNHRSKPIASSRG